MLIPTPTEYYFRPELKGILRALRKPCIETVLKLSCRKYIPSTISVHLWNCGELLSTTIQTAYSCSLTLFREEDVVSALQNLEKDLLSHAHYSESDLEKKLMEVCYITK